MILKAAGDTNLKKVTLELGGKSPNVVFDDCDCKSKIVYQAKVFLIICSPQVYSSDNKIKCDPNYNSSKYKYVDLNEIKSVAEYYRLPSLKLGECLCVRGWRGLRSPRS